MNEIELKAHVSDTAAVKKRLDSFAEYAGFVSRSDVYYKQGNRAVYPIRVRREKGDAGEQILLTYKRKSLEKSADGTAIERNEERESVISEETLAVLQAFFADNGFSEYLRKEKSVSAWHCRENGFDVNLELCTVAPLGDFLELEILSEKESDFALARKTLEALLQRAGIEKSAVEEKSYSEMLKIASK